MILYTKHIQQSFRFRRWSRNGWSVFASLGRLVTIGMLHGDVSGQALVKMQLPVDCNQASELNTCWDEEEELAELQLQELEMMTAQVLAPVGAPCSGAHSININQAVDTDYTRINRFFYFII